MTISHSDYVAKCRRKYRRIDHGYDEALRLHLLGSERAAARRGLDHRLEACAGIKTGKFPPLSPASPVRV